MSTSGYTICYESDTRGQALEKSLESFLAVCDEVVVVDCNDATDPDGSSARLQSFAAQQQRLVVLEHRVDADAPGAAFELFCAAPTLARRACKGDVLLEFELDDFADVDRAEELGELARQLTLEGPEIAGYALPRASYCGEQGLIDARDAVACCLTRNDAFFVHDVPRAMRRFDADGALRTTRDFAPARSRVRSDTLEELRFRCVFDPQLTTWLERARGLGDDALLARDCIQAELATAIERGPAIFSTRALHGEAALRWQRDREARCLAALRVDESPVEHALHRRPWSELSDDELAQLAARARRYGETTVRCARAPSAAVLELLSAHEVATT